MPAFNLHYIKAATYKTSGAAVTVGEAMSANLSLRFAEGRLYTEKGLAEYLRKAVGGSISLAVKYIPDAAQKLLFGAEEKTRTVASKQVKSLVHDSKLGAPYVKLAFYAPDRVDGAQKYTCVYVYKALFGMPDMTFTAPTGDTITFNTPTTSGEFLPADTDEAELLEVAVCDTEDEAKAWCDAVLGGAV